MPGYAPSGTGHPPQGRARIEFVECDSASNSGIREAMSIIHANRPQWQELFLRNRGARILIKDGQAVKVLLRVDGPGSRACQNAPNGEHNNSHIFFDVGLASGVMHQQCDCRKPGCERFRFELEQRMSNQGIQALSRTDDGNDDVISMPDSTQAIELGESQDGHSTTTLYSSPSTTTTTIMHSIPSDATSSRASSERSHWC